MENKSIGGALVDVFDAAVSLIRSEITAVARRIGNIAKAKGLGVVLLLGSLVPLTLASIFLILFVFYGLIRLGLAAWSASLIMGLVSLIVTGALIFIGLKRLGADVPEDGGSGKPRKLSEVEKDDLLYGNGMHSNSPSGANPIPGSTTPGTHGTGPIGSHGPTPAPASGVTAPGATQASSTQAAYGTVVGGTVAGTAARSDQTLTGHTTGGHLASPRPQASPVQGDAYSGPAARPGAQSTSTQGRGTHENEQAGIPVSTHPTYPEDMKKEGY